MSDYMVTESSGPAAIRYRSIVVWIHWLTAALVVTQIWLGFTFGDYPRGSPERTELFTWHKTVGALILVMALVRLGVRLMNPPPPYPQDFPRWERALADPNVASKEAIVRRKPRLSQSNSLLQSNKSVAD